MDFIISVIFYHLYDIIFRLFPHLSPQIPLHHLLYRLIVIAAAEKIIQLRDGCLRRHVVSAHCPRAGEAAAGLIGAEVDCALRALGANDEHRAVFGRAIDDRQERAPVAGYVAGSKCLDDDAAELFGHDLLEERELDSWKDLYYADRETLKQPNPERTLRLWPERVGIVANRYARFRKQRIVR